MARIPETEIERLKHEVSVERLVEASGVKLKKAGKDWLGRCPFHDDAEASLVVTPAKNLWHCFGCQVGGGPIDWVMKREGVSFRHAVELLREGVVASSSTRVVKQATVPKLSAPIALDADDQAALDQAIEYYHATLKASPEALAYLDARGIRSEEAIATFKLGFANRTLGLRLPDKNRVAGAELRARLERVGILRASGHEHFRGSLVVPVFDEAGHVVEAYGRKMTPASHLRPGTPLHLYLPGHHRGPARGVWNLAAFGSSKEIILCEALIDALSFWCAGYRHVTAAYGVEGFTDEHRAAFARYGTERVLIAYDRDEAGDRAAERLAVELLAAGIECFRIEFPKGMDANSYALKLVPAQKSLGLAIRKASWMGQGVRRVLLITTPVSEAVTAADATLPSSAFRLSQTVSTELLPLAAEAAPPAASPLPLAPPPEPPLEANAAEVVIDCGDRRYRVRGLAKNLAYECLRVNIAAERGEAVHVDTVDLRVAKPTASYITQAAAELGVTPEVIKADMRLLLRRLEALQQELICQHLAPKKPAVPSMTEAEHAAALALLRSPDLLDRIAADLEAYGLVGEATNKRVAYLAATSRKLERPLALLVQSSSAAGKSSLMEAILAFVPEEERVKYSAMTGQSLFYMRTENLSHKILAIAEETGAQQAAYALKLLQSEGELTIASTGKDAAGNLVTQDYTVKGPVMLFTTTTAADIDEELKNRCLVLAVDESRAQTRAIHQVQRTRRTLEGLFREQRRPELAALHRNAQRLLRPLGVLNPYAQGLTFPDQATRTRRDHEKYLTLIDTLALLHQHQCPVKTATRANQTVEYIEATLADIALANALAHEVLGRSLDELPPQTRHLLALVDAYVRAECERASIDRSAYRFSRRQVREAIGWGDTQLRIHLDRLLQLEYVLARREGAGGRFVYELLYDGGGTEGKAFVPGLIDVAALRTVITTAEVAGLAREVAGQPTEVAGRLRVDRGPIAGRSRPDALAESPATTRLCDESGAASAKPQYLAEHIEAPSYIAAD